MRIVFICGGIEPGKDGVGDYTRKMADALTKLGLSAFILSINDAYIDKPTRQTQYEGKNSIDVLRLPASDSWKERAKSAKRCIEEQAPDWLSLQYVPYSFHKKGLPFGLAGWLTTIGGNRNWHIMFHELWLGIKSDAPFKHYGYGFIQKRLISDLVRQLSPLAIDTSNRVYQLELKTRNIEAKIVPLFSNIAFLPIDDDFVTRVYKKLGKAPVDASYFYMLGGFGAIHNGMNLKELISEQSAFAASFNKQLVYVTFGRSSFDKQVETLESELKDKAVFCNLGELPERQLSTVLQLLDKGVCGTPKEYIGKSGVYAAMKRHNLPVVIRSGMVIPQYKLEIEKFNNYLESRDALEWDVKYIATTFYENIRLHTNLQPG